LLNGGIHLAGKQGLAHVTRVVLGEVFFLLGPEPLVFLEAVAHPLQFSLQFLQPLLLLRNKLPIKVAAGHDSSWILDSKLQSLPVLTLPRFIPTNTTGD
jgi:hypothetical protein